MNQLRGKYFTTAAIYYCNIALGVTTTFLSPGLIDFRDGLNVGTQTLSIWMTAARAICLVSALAFGFIYNHLPRHLLVIFLLFFIGLIGALYPYSGTILVFGILTTVQFICAGGYLTAQIVWVMDIWKDAAGPFIQAQHFFFALGTIFPPLIFAPYLSSNSTEEDSNHVVGNGTEKASLEHLQAPSAICGSIISLGALFLFLTYCLVKENQSRGSKSSQEILTDAIDVNIDVADGASVGQTRDKEDPSVGRSEKLERAEVASAGTSREDETLGNARFNENASLKEKKRLLYKKILLIALASALIGATESMEGITMTFLPTFGRYSELELSSSEGANLLTGYTVAYTLGRLAGIFIILKISPNWILWGNVTLILLANLVLLFPGSNSLAFMYAGSILLGLGFSTCVPSVFAYIQLHLDVTNVIGSVLAVSGASIAAVFPMIVGTYIEDTPKILTYLNLGCVLVSFVSLASVMLVMRNNRGKL